MIIQDITKELKNFLWQGGKSNGTKKFHLVNWETVCRPKFCRGEGIKYLGTMNISLGAKILWRIVLGKKAWWKDILRKNTLVEKGKDSLIISLVLRTTLQFGDYAKMQLTSFKMACVDLLEMENIFLYWKKTLALILLHLT